MFDQAFGYVCACNDGYGYIQGFSIRTGVSVRNKIRFRVRV